MLFLCSLKFAHGACSLPKNNPFLNGKKLIQGVVNGIKKNCIPFSGTFVSLENNPAGREAIVGPTQ